MVKNKYGGINDMPKGWCKENKRFYALWYDMLRRCYDDEQQRRSKGRSYRGCSVCKEWFTLSCFSDDIQNLPGYSDWASGANMFLDKDTIVEGNREYSPKTCRFLTAYESVMEMNKRNPEITKNANESHKTGYALAIDGKITCFDSEKSACEYLGVVKCSVASCYRRGRMCKGHLIYQIQTVA